MQPLSNFFTLLSDDELEMLHDSALKLLENPGMKIENEELLEALKNRGAWVDFDTAIVRFPGELVKEAIEIAKSRNLNGFIECNPKTGENVEKAFEALTRLILEELD